MEKRFEVGKTGRGFGVFYVERDEGGRVTLRDLVEGGFFARSAAEACARAYREDAHR